jgi:O-antigen/teichoic acid export membrane protein
MYGFYEEVAVQPKRSTRILKNIAALLLGQITTNLLSLLVTIYVPRRMGPTAVGELAVANILTTLLATILALGMGTLLVRDMVRSPEKAADLMGAAIALRMLMALPSLFFVAAVVWIVGYSSTTQVVIAITSVGMVLGMLSGPFESGFQAFERMKYNSLSAVVSEMIVMVASVAVIMAGGGVVWLSIVNTVAALVVLFLDLKWWLSLGAVHLHFNLKLIRYLLMGGLSFWAIGLFSTIYLYVDSFMLSVMTDDTVVGWYNVPMRLFGFLLFIPTIVGTAMFPPLARTYKQAPREMVKLARRSFNLLTCLALPIAVGGVLLSKQVIFTLYGLAFGPSIPILTVLSAMAVPMYINIQVYQLLVVTERQNAWTKVMAGACVINPLMNLVLINFYQQHHQNGAYGAAWAMLLTEGLMAVIGIALLPRGVLGWSNVVSGVKSAAAAGLMALAIWYTRDYFIAIPIAAGGITYCGAVLLLGVFPREEFETLQMIGGKFLSKVGLNRLLPQTGTKGL